MLWPDAEERRLLGRFYLSGALGYGLALITPFQFAYLYLVMDQPAWAVIPLVVANAVSLVMEIPTGLISDRWSRKKCVLLGYGLSAAAWAAIPFAAGQEGTAQLVAICACFALDGLGDAFASGSEESWVVDNLASEGRDDLVGQFFARTYSFEALGSVIAGLAAFLIVLSVPVSSGLLNLLWLTTAAGQILALVVVWPLPERRAPPGAAPFTANAGTLLIGLRALVRNRALLFFLAVLVIASLSDSAPEDAFVISMLTKGLDARALAPLTIVEDLIGLAAPVFAVALARRMGTRRFLATFLALPALAVLALVMNPALWVVVTLCLVLDACAMLWDPIAEAHLQRLFTSANRATMTSVANQLTSAANMVGLAVFGMMLGDTRTALDEATPDLATAFSGEPSQAIHLPAVALGLSVPDLAIVTFVWLGILAAPLLIISFRRRSAKPEVARRPAIPVRRRIRRKI